MDEHHVQLTEVCTRVFSATYTTRLKSDTCKSYFFQTTYLVLKIEDTEVIVVKATDADEGVNAQISTTCSEHNSNEIMQLCKCMYYKLIIKDLS